MARGKRSADRRATLDTSGEPARALLYIRVSTNDQAREGLSLPAQLRACQQYAARQGWVIEDEYQDVLSGRRDDRPGYSRLLHDVRRLREGRRPVTVVVPWLHRF